MLTHIFYPNIDSGFLYPIFFSCIAIHSQFIFSSIWLLYISSQIARTPFFFLNISSSFKFLKLLALNWNSLISSIQKEVLKIGSLYLDISHIPFLFPFCDFVIICDSYRVELMFTRINRPMLHHEPLGLVIYCLFVSDT